MELLNLRNVSCDLSTAHVRTRAVDNVTLSISDGDFLSIMGPSGAGKSTLLNMLGLLNRPTAGTLQAFGEDATRLPYRHLARLRRENIGFIFQSFFLLPEITVIENVELALRVLGRRELKEGRDRARDLLDRLGLSARAMHYPQQLSGGQQQRVAIARALVTRPKIVIADEPTGNLDREAAIGVLGILQELAAEGVSICIVSHDSTVASVARNRFVMSQGRLEASVTEKAAC